MRTCGRDLHEWQQVGLHAVAHPVGAARGQQLQLPEVESSGEGRNQLGERGGLLLQRLQPAAVDAQAARDGEQRLLVHDGVQQQRDEEATVQQGQRQARGGRGRTGGRRSRPV